VNTGSVYRYYGRNDEIWVTAGPVTGTAGVLIQSVKGAGCYPSRTSGQYRSPNWVVTLGGSKSHKGHELSLTQNPSLRPVDYRYSKQCASSSPRRPLEWSRQINRPAVWVCVCAQPQKIRKITFELNAQYYIIRSYLKWPK